MTTIEAIQELMEKYNEYRAKFETKFKKNFNEDNKWFIGQIFNKK